MKANKDNKVERRGSLSQSIKNQLSTVYYFTKFIIGGNSEADAKKSKT